jgi:hypothetical protein
MPEHASRFAGLYDQQNENRIPDWGGDELFTRMPSRPAVDDAPAPRFRSSLVAPEAVAPAPQGSLALVEQPEDRRRTLAGEERSGPRDRRRAPGSAGQAMLDRRRAPGSAAQAMLDRAERLGLSVVEPSPEPVHRWDQSGTMIEPEPAGRRTKVITGHPGGVPRPLPTMRAERRRPSRSPAEWVGARPERIVAWAFVLGLVLILIAISTADAAAV